MENIQDNRRREIFDWIESVAVAVTCVILAMVFIAKVYTVRETSMYPTLENGSKLIALNIYRDVRPGDIIIFEDPELKESLIKRVIAVGGDEIDIDMSGNVYVNGEISEFVASGEWNLRGNLSYPLTVPEGQLFVMGDNRSVSLDSRDSRVGFVYEREVCAVARFTIYPFSKFGKVS